MQRRTWGAVACAVAALWATGAQAQANYPNQPITLLVPYAAGGTTDVLARALANSMGKLLKQSVIVENRPGAGGHLPPAVSAENVV
jgi:tripartite-type tricarboxylate transporter receptor subunit TctC